MNANLKRWAAIAFAGVVVLALVGFGFYLLQEPLDDSVGQCAPFERSDLSLQQPRWQLTRPESARMVIALDDYTNHARRGGTTVDVLKAEPAKPNQPAALPPTVQLGALIRGGELTDGDHSLRSVVGRAIRQRDGLTVRARVCAQRKDRAETPPGRYAGTLRVAGPSVVPTDVPVEVTIRGARTVALAIALVVSLVGAFLAAFNSKAPENVDDQAKEKKRYKALSVLPLISGVVAGLAAGLVIYLDDPTFGASGGDYLKLVIGTFAAATGGLTLVAAPTRAAQKRVPHTA